MAFISGSTNISAVPWLGDQEYGGLPALLPKSNYSFYCNIPNGGMFIYDPEWNAGTWADGFRGTVYLKLKNNGASSPNIYVDIARVAEGAEFFPWGRDFVDSYQHVLAPGEEYVFEIDLSSWLVDVYTISIWNANTAGIEIVALQTTPFTASVFWRGHHGVTELL